MKKINYFDNIVTTLEKDSVAALESSCQITFSTLKILEYWIRILQQNPECINKEVAIRLMNEPYLNSMVKDVVKLFKPIMKKDKKTDEFDSNVCNNRFLSQIDRYINEAKPGFQRAAMTNLLRPLINADNDDMAPHLYQAFLDIVRKHFTKFAMDTLRQGISEKDVSYNRMLKVKSTYRLSDDEVELLLYLWLKESRDLSIECENEGLYRSRRFRDNDSNSNSLANIARATGFPIEKLTKLLGKGSSLNRLNLVDDDLDIPREVRLYLSGYSDGAEMKAFKLADKPNVPFKQLQGTNPDAALVLDMITSYNREKPLNILFYGTEGTGKTELAKALAKEAKLPLWEVAIDIDDDELSGPPRRDGRSACLLQYRLRAITLADWQCEQKPGIILVDEADLILNCAEKGALNSFFESLKTPVIWISNSLNLVERSTRRRFDFSMAFKPLAKDERVSVLNSVLKAQKATKLLTDEEKLKLVVEYPAMAGGMTLAVQHTKSLMKSGFATDAYKTMARLLKAHTNLMGIQNGSLKEIQAHAPSYSLEGLNIQGSTEEIMEMVRNYDEVWKGLEEDSAPNSLNILLYGPPGTGKTEFVRHLARSLGRNLIIKRASDLLGMYVGQTEAQIAEAFEEANRTKSILFFDEADSFLNSRSGATRNYEVTKVNELLTQMENFKGIFIAATNFEKFLDPASNRRFAVKLGFDYLNSAGIPLIWNVFFPDIACPESVMQMSMLTPGDFNAVSGRLKYLPASLRTADRIAQELRSELKIKDSRCGRTMGF